ncbi:hypothetical protein LINPERHAP1_LOCUS39710, partial [Linum perenne]
PVGSWAAVEDHINCFLVKFANDRDYLKALTNGPWMILDHYLIVHQWNHDFCVFVNMPKIVVRVKFAHLSIQFYHAQVPSSLGNLIGNMVKIDFNTQKAYWGRITRIAVEIDLDGPLQVVVELDGTLQMIEYENVPTLCFKCGKVGHEMLACPRIYPPETVPLTTYKESPVVDDSLVPAPTLEGFGPWMLVSRNYRRKIKESAGVLPEITSPRQNSKEEVKEGKRGKDSFPNNFGANFKNQSRISVTSDMVSLKEYAGPIHKGKWGTFGRKVSSLVWKNPPKGQANLSVWLPTHSMESGPPKILPS